MTSYRLSRLAQDDVQAIWDFTIRSWSYDQAEEYVFGLIDYLDDLNTHVFMAKSMDHIRTGYMRLSYQKHHVYFMTDENGTYNIMRILHQHMDNPRHLK